MKILMTGDRGYIGTVMKPYLQKHGHEVVGLDTNYFKNCTLFEYGKPEAHEPHIDMDIRDIGTHYSFLFDDYDAVIHLAGLSNDVMGDIDSKITEDINYVATIKLAEMAKQAGIPRFLFASSCSIYGSNEYVVDETTPVNPQTLYANLKFEAEQAISKLADERFSPTFLRNATVFGLSRRMRNDLVVNTMTAKAYVDGKIQVFGTNNLWRPLVHAVDVAKAFLLTLEAGRYFVHNQVINVGFTKENYTVPQVARIVQDKVKHTDIEFIHSEDTRNYHVNFDKIKNMFPEFDRPHKDVASEVIKINDVYKDLEALREHQFVDDDLLGERFVRLKRLKALVEDGKLDESFRWKVE